MHDCAVVGAVTSQQEGFGLNLLADWGQTPHKGWRLHVLAMSRNKVGCRE